MIDFVYPDNEAFQAWQRSISYVWKIIVTLTSELFSEKNSAIIKENTTCDINSVKNKISQTLNVNAHVKKSFLYSNITILRKMQAC